MRARLLRSTLASVVGAGLLVVAPSAAADTGPLFNPDNGHFYEAVAVPGGINWSDARAAAEAREHRGATGHLVTITSAEEDAFVVANFPEAFPVVDLPRTPACDVLPPLIGENTCGEAWWMGGFQGADGVEPAGGWEWVTGEPFVYSNWAPGEPSQFMGVEEDCLAPHPEAASPRWNDVHCDDEKAGGYLVEYEPTPRPCPMDPAPFTDVSATSFAKTDIDCIYGLNITTGTSPTTYSPADNVTREQMAAFLARIWRAS